jgi:hypothetical protein
VRAMARARAMAWARSRAKARARVRASVTYKRDKKLRDWAPHKSRVHPET